MLVNGIYQVTRPYDAGAQYAKVLEVTFKQKNILSTLKSQEFKVRTVVPTGATAVAPSSTLITELGTQQVTINSNTVLGLYTFTYELGGKTQVVRLQVNEAKPEITTSERFTDEEYFNPVTGELIPFGVALETGDEEYTYVPTDSTGVFLVEKPFASTLNTKTLLVDFVAKNFVADDFLDNQYTVNLFGPSTNITGITQLFAGIELEDTEAAGLNNDDLSTNNTFESFNGQLLTTGGALRTRANGLVTQIIDRGTPVGDYTFTVTATNANGTSAASSASNSITAIAPFVATGGTEVTSDGFKYHKFTANGTFAVTSGSKSVEVLTIAGGGGAAGGKLLFIP
jgi:hypothetical protein